MSPRVVLVGPMGAGKTTVGRLLAQLLGVSQLDTDDLIVAAAGKPIAEIFVDDGEDAFRALERAAVAQALAEHDGIVSLGGGAVGSEVTRALLREAAELGTVIAFLDVDWRSVERRVGLDRSRPLLVGSPRKQWQELMAARRALYQAVATHTFDTTDARPGELAQQIKEQLDAH